MVEWLVAAAVFLALLSLLPPLLRRAKSQRRSSGGSGVFIAIGMGLAMIFDPKASQATEIVQRKDENGDEEGGESGEKP